MTLPDGTTAYTRAGSLHLTREGRLVTAEGYPLQPEITIPAERHLRQHLEGRHRLGHVAGQTAAQQVGTIELATFQNPAGLLALGGNLFSATTASGEPDDRRARASTAAARWRRASSRTPTSASSRRW